MFVSGRKITSFSLVKVYNSGNIDLVGNQTCELKIGYYASGNVDGNILLKNLFKYSLCMTR